MTIDKHSGTTERTTATGREKKVRKNLRFETALQGHTQSKLLNVDKVANLRITRAATEEAMWIFGAPEETALLRLYRPALLELRIETPDFDFLKQLVEAIEPLVQALGFVTVRTFQPREGSAVQTLGLATAIRVNRAEAQVLVERNNSALRERNSAETRSKIILNYAKAFAAVVGSLGVVATISIKLLGTGVVSEKHENTTTTIYCSGGEYETDGGKKAGVKTQAKPVKSKAPRRGPE